MGMNPPDYLKEGDEMKLKVDYLGEQKTKVSKEI
jgi:2-keto-4-pentenoate hydratase/2-oxohepta-3-ene-1,7-dioic acid hydratase in catechol pathway